MEDLVYRLRKRAEIRRGNTERKSVQEGKPDRISDLLEEAAKEIEMLNLKAHPAYKTEASELLQSFIEHCKQYPTERFWQALRNWSGRNFILACDNKENIGAGEYDDTFYWKTKDGKKP